MLPFEKEYVEKENAKLIEIRKEFFNYLDNNIPKNSDGSYNFSENPKLDAKDVYERFFKLDYQARKLRALLVQTYDLKAE
jgi:hypothetical protein